MHTYPMALAFLFLFLCRHALSAGDASGLVEQLRQKAARVRSFTADVTVDVAIPSFRVPQARGTLTAHPPDSVSFRSEQLTFIPKNGWQLNPLMLLQREHYIAIEDSRPTPSTVLLRLFPRSDTGEIIAAKMTIDLRDTTPVRTEITMRNAGSIALDFQYGVHRSLLLPDRIIMHVNIPATPLPKAFTGDIAPTTSNGVKPKQNEPLKGTITVTFVRYTSIERRNFTLR